MLKRIHPDLSGRVLPLRSGHFTISNPQARALHGQIWFTPEIIIWDAISVLGDLLYLWRLFRQSIRLFAFRALIISSLIFLLLSFTKLPQQAAAGLSATDTGASWTNQPSAYQITAEIRAQNAPTFTWPVPKTYISTYFSAAHMGIDIPSSWGTAIRPIASGEVVFAGWDGGFGKTVLIRHERGYLSRYSHLSSVFVKTSQKVDSTTILGGIGTTGLVTGPHLHLEIHKNGVAINPLNLLP